MLDLTKLADPNVRETLLRAEVAAWLHDVGKCADAFLQPGGIGFNASSCQAQPRVNPHKAVFSPDELPKLPYWSSLSPERGQCSRLEEAKHPTALWRTLIDLGIGLPSCIVGLSCSSSHSDFPSIPELVLWGRPLVADRYQRFQNILGQPRAFLAAILGWSHKIAHMEKEDDADGGQGNCIDSPFGFKCQEIQNLNQKIVGVLRAIQTRPMHQQKILIVRQIYQRAPGDTRRPINEVTLWDWSSVVAALYKAEIARCVLTRQQRQPKDIRWRLLSIRTDGLEYMLSGSSIPDLLARKDLLTNAWNRVQKVLEEEYPLALEVYRDENGPVFVVPDIDNLLDLANSAENNKTLREYIVEAFRQGTVKEDPCLAINGEIVPYFEVDKKPWKGQPAPQELPPIGEHLKTTPTLQSDPEAVAQPWCHLPKPQEVCTVCGLRPQGPSKKARERGMCDVCEERRADRAKAWAANIGQAFLATIWLDEVADRNGRLALIVGTFDLSHWLDGTLVRSLAVRTPNDQNGHTEDEVAKNPSFARLRRIWETTRRFWQDVAPTEAPPKELQDFCNSQDLDLKDLWEGPLNLEESLAGEAMREKRPRLFLKGKLVQGDLGPFHAYEMEVQGRKVAVLWVPPEGKDVESIPEEYRGGFWVIENLEYLRKQFRKDFREVLREGTPYDVYEPSDYGRPGRAMAQFVVGEKKNGPEYTPLIPVLAEPRTFMALVPADRALDVVRAIKTKYEREMGKVRNRLPLHLGIVFADAHQPLRTILDAGRRMLKQKALGPVEEWQVVEDVALQTDPLPAQAQALANGTQQFSQWYAIKIHNPTLSRTLTWYVPAAMGDGQKDWWYPYVFLAQENEPEDREIYYKAVNPWNKNHSWLVHAKKLKAGDTIYFTPATLDFIWLDHGGRRFEIDYDQKGRRHGTLRRPYLLDELEELEACWKLLAGDPEKKVRRLSTTQLHAVRDLIETKRAEWFEQPEKSLRDQTFEAFCKDVLTNAQWTTRPHKDEMQHLTCWAVTGLLADAVELFYHILKQRPVGEEEGAP